MSVTYISRRQGTNVVVAGNGRLTTDASDSVYISTSANITVLRHGTKMFEPAYATSFSPTPDIHDRTQNTGISITTDGSDNLYVLGYGQGPVYNLDGTMSSVTLLSDYLNVVSLVKYNSNGVALWASAIVENSMRTWGLRRNTVMVNASGDIFVILPVTGRDGTATQEAEYWQASLRMWYVYNASGTGQSLSPTVGGNEYLGYSWREFYGSGVGSRGAGFIKFNQSGIAQCDVGIFYADDDYLRPSWYTHADCVQSAALNPLTGGFYVGGMFWSDFLYPIDTAYRRDPNAIDVYLYPPWNDEVKSCGFAMQFDASCTYLQSVRVSGARAAAAFSKVAVNASGDFFAAGFNQGQVSVFNGNTGFAPFFGPHEELPLSQLAPITNDSTFVIKYNCSGVAQWRTCIEIPESAANQRPPQPVDLVVSSDGGVVMCAHCESHVFPLTLLDASGATVASVNSSESMSLVVWYNNVGRPINTARVVNARTTSAVLSNSGQLFIGVTTSMNTHAVVVDAEGSQHNLNVSRGATGSHIVHFNSSGIVSFHLLLDSCNSVCIESRDAVQDAVHWRTLALSNTRSLHVAGHYDGGLQFTSSGVVAQRMPVSVNHASGVPTLFTVKMVEQSYSHYALPSTLSAADQGFNKYVYNNSSATAFVHIMDASAGASILLTDTLQPGALANFIWHDNRWLVPSHPVIPTQGGVITSIHVSGTLTAQQLRTTVSPVPVASGGTGRQSFNTHSLLVGDETRPVMAPTMLRRGSSAHNSAFVGIGIPDPEHALHVDGDINYTGELNTRRDNRRYSIDDSVLSSRVLSASHNMHVHRGPTHAFNASSQGAALIPVSAQCTSMRYVIAGDGSGYVYVAAFSQTAWEGPLYNQDGSVSDVSLSSSGNMALVKYHQDGRVAWGATLTLSGTSFTTSCVMMDSAPDGYVSLMCNVDGVLQVFDASGTGQCMSEQQMLNTSGSAVLMFDPCGVCQWVQLKSGKRANGLRVDASRRVYAIYHWYDQGVLHSQVERFQPDGVVDTGFSWLSDISGHVDVAVDVSFSIYTFVQEPEPVPYDASLVPHVLLNAYTSHLEKRDASGVSLWRKTIIHNKDVVPPRLGREVSLTVEKNTGLVSVCMSPCSSWHVIGDVVDTSFTGQFYFTSSDATPYTMIAHFDTSGIFKRAQQVEGGWHTPSSVVPDVSGGAYMIGSVDASSEVTLWHYSPQSTMCKPICKAGPGTYVVRFDACGQLSAYLLLSTSNGTVQAPWQYSWPPQCQPNILIESQHVKIVCNVCNVSSILMTNVFGETTGTWPIARRTGIVVLTLPHPQIVEDENTYLLPQLSSQVSSGFLKVIQNMSSDDMHVQIADGSGTNVKFLLTPNTRANLVWDSSTMQWIRLVVPFHQGGFGWTSVDQGKLIVGGLQYQTMDYMPYTPSGLHWDVSNNRLGIGTSSPLYPLHVHGCNASGVSVTATSVLQNSDARLKIDIEPITNAADKVLQLQGYTYTRNDGPTAMQGVGVLAQEVLKVLPEAVVQQPDGLYGVNYSSVVALLVSAVNELCADVEALEADMGLTDT